MEQCKKCRYFRYINKGLLTNYAGCEKYSVSIMDPTKCNAYKHVSLWSCIRGVFEMIRIWLYVKTKGKIDFGVGKQFQKFEEMVKSNTHVE